MRSPGSLLPPLSAVQVCKGGLILWVYKSGFRVGGARLAMGGGVDAIGRSVPIGKSAPGRHSR